MDNNSHRQDRQSVLRRNEVRKGDDGQQLRDTSPVFSWQRVAGKVRFAPEPVDVVVQCPKCKAIETLQFVGRTMTPSRKFSQRDGHIYHDCGSTKPCNIHSKLFSSNLN